MEEKNWQAWARLRPNNNIPIYGVDDLGLRPIDDGSLPRKLERHQPIVVMD